MACADSWTGDAPRARVLVRELGRLQSLYDHGSRSRHHAPDQVIGASQKANGEKHTKVCFDALMWTTATGRRPPTAPALRADGAPLPTHALVGRIAEQEKLHCPTLHRRPRGRSHERNHPIDHAGRGDCAHKVTWTAGPMARFRADAATAVDPRESRVRQSRRLAVLRRR